MCIYRPEAEAYFAKKKGLPAVPVAGRPPKAISYVQQLACEGRSAFFTLPVEIGAGPRLPWRMTGHPSASRKMAGNAVSQAFRPLLPG